MGLDIFVLFNIFNYIFNYCRFASYSEFAFHCFNYILINTESVFCEWDELMHIHI